MSEIRLKDSSLKVTIKLASILASRRRPRSIEANWSPRICLNEMIHHIKSEEGKKKRPNNGQQRAIKTAQISTSVDPKLGMNEIHNHSHGR